MSYTKQNNIDIFDEYEEVEIRVGQYIKFTDSDGFVRVGKVLRVDVDMNTVLVSYGCIVFQTQWVLAEDITEA